MIQSVQYGKIPVREYFTIISESNAKITKSVTLAYNIVAQMDMIIQKYLHTTQLNIESEILGYNHYEYITERQYRDILTRLTAEGKYDFSADGLINTIIESDDINNYIKEKAHLISKTVELPVFSYPKVVQKNRKYELFTEYIKLYKHYDYLLNVVFADTLDSGVRMTPFQMKQMNVINKDIRKIKRMKWKILND